MKRVTFLLLMITCLFSCSKKSTGSDNNEGLAGIQKPAVEALCLDGAIYWTADPAADGIGWHFSAKGANQEAYVFDNLPEEYQVKGLPVSICMYKTDQKMAVFSSMNFIYKYHVTSIKRR